MRRSLSNSECAAGGSRDSGRRTRTSIECTRTDAASGGAGGGAAHGVPVRDGATPVRPRSLDAVGASRAPLQRSPVAAVRTRLRHLGLPAESRGTRRVGFAGDRSGATGRNGPWGADRWRTVVAGARSPLEPARRRGPGPHGNATV